MSYFAAAGNLSSLSFGLNSKKKNVYIPNFGQFIFFFVGLGSLSMKLLSQIHLKRRIPLVWDIVFRFPISSVIFSNFLFFFYRKNKKEFFPFRSKGGGYLIEYWNIYINIFSYDLKRNYVCKKSGYIFF